MAARNSFLKRRETRVQLLLLRLSHAVMCDQARVPLHPDATLHLPLFRLKRRPESTHPGLSLAADAWQGAGGPRWALRKPHPCRAPYLSRKPSNYAETDDCLLIPVPFGQAPAIISLQVWRTLYVWSFWTISHGKGSLKAEISSWIPFHQKDARHLLRANAKAGSIF